MRHSKLLQTVTDIPLAYWLHSLPPQPIIQLQFSRALSLFNFFFSFVKTDVFGQKNEQKRKEGIKI
jgi:hypothetical protein